MIEPQRTQPTGAFVENGILWLADADLWGKPLPLKLGAALETEPIYIQGFNAFQAWLSVSGSGRVGLDYGICHPGDHAVVGYRTLIEPDAPSASMMATFGAAGGIAAFRGDLFTAMTLRLKVSGSITLAGAVLWCGIR